MKPALGLLALTAAGLMILSWREGYAAAYSVAYGAVVAMALSISATFFWLWFVRATPLALGMAFSWAGTCGVMGWWWLYNRLGEPGWMSESSMLFVFVAAYFVGGLLHFQVIVRSLGVRAVLVLVPPAFFVVAGLFM